ncbi:MULTISPECIES: phosphatase PAP2 family protein [Oceanimonas]|uniref:undecaprenyl-diphosphate phosphatase n=1 Tax=Oceanimonas doudoroffii TaxID=84158 RepID=A0A233RFA0_9GAMM|nr:MULTISPECIES: phosphatase PAP2 family protein [Oceanimonas]NHI01568.1 Phosphatidylglycerophosphatase B [Oceanimonas sp. MB9]OXY82059.1 phosphatidylglycerophosphatase [Oceanimonas doudoroffii]
MTLRLLLLVCSLLILPVALASLAWQWQWHWFPLLDLDEPPALLAYGLTLTVGKLGIGITLLALSMLALHRGRRRPALLLAFFFCLFAALGGAFVTKTVAKLYFKEPRPYVLWLVQQGRLADSASFYAIPEAAREQQLQQSLLGVSDTQIPGWLKHHWQEEVNYSFPSGHSIAAMTIAGFFCLVLGYRRQPAWHLVALAGWAVAVCYSRLLLGLHWPADILASSVLGVLFGGAGAWAFSRLDQRLGET